MMTSANTPPRDDHPKQSRVLKTADLSWREVNEEGTAPNTPYSDVFDDIYFSGRGPEETHHVFLMGNHLDARFRHADIFTIGELGFGTGLNFLCTWALWDQCEKPRNSKLHFLTFEKFPLRRDDFIRAAQSWPSLACYVDRLSTAWPPPTAGFHQISLGDVTLTIFHGDVKVGLTACISAPFTVDAWFLDGFSPARNSDMWHADVFRQIGSLSAEGATLATFTVAGQIRRDLIAAGFDVDRTQGFGKKRHMLTGTLRQKSEANCAPRSKDLPWTSTQSLSPIGPAKKIAIIGGGIAGASLAYTLNHQGLSCVIIDPEGLAQGASGNAAGLIMPRLDRTISPTSDFFISAWLYTIRLISQLTEYHPTLFNPCAITRSDKDQASIDKLHDLAQGRFLPEDWMYPTKQGVTFPHAGVIDPIQFVTILAGDTPLIRMRVNEIYHASSRYHLETDNGDILHADGVVFANGLGALKFLQARGLPLGGSVGQIDLYTNEYGDKPGVTFGPYAAPTPTANGMVLGATYEPFTPGALASDEQSKISAASNLEALRALAPDLVSGIDVTKAQSRRSVRCVTPDRLPVAGPLPDWAQFAASYDGLRYGRTANGSNRYEAAQYQQNMFILSGLGSRGLVTAPYCAAMIAAQFCGNVPPCDKAIYDLLHPGRFFIRTLKRAKPVRAHNRKSTPESA